MTEQKVVKFRVLEKGGDYYQWVFQTKSHFGGKGYWEYVSQGVEPEIDKDGNLTVEMNRKKCKGDLLKSIYPDVALALRKMK